MRLEIIVEEPSTEAALRALIPRIVMSNVKWKIITFSGKSDLIKNLPNRLKGYKARLRNEKLKIIVLVDRDKEDCDKLKSSLELISKSARMTTLTSVNQENRRSAVVGNRIAIEELEAWFFGDLEAIIKAYPNVAPHIPKKYERTNPDNIQGGTAEQLGKLLKKGGSHKGGLKKIRAARDIAPHLNIINNHSKSFNIFKKALLTLTS